jgi:hypothetical protein
MEQAISTSMYPINKNHPFKKWLQQSSLPGLILYLSVASFTVYSSMYGFRKPFTAASYNQYTLWGISYKSVLVIAQVIGYAISKFYGIQFIGGMQPAKRAVTIIKLMLIAWISLLLFAVIPFPYNWICMFINGLPLGMIWGLVFGFLEGRRITELVGAVMATSFIFASGLAKTIGKWLLLHLPVNEWQMPFASASIFFIPLLIGVWMLQQVPPPSATDIAMRTVRNPMNETERIQFVKQLASILIPVIITYALLTVLRDFSEDFSNELWTETGFGNNASIFAQTSTFISIVVLTAIGGFFLIRNNFKAFQLTHFVIIAGFALTITATILFQQKLITPFAWFIAATSGLYLGYVPYNCLYFERMIATFKVQGNVGFVMYIADAFGYLGTVLVLLMKEFITIKYSWVHFFTTLFYVASFVGIILIVTGYVASIRLYKKRSI